MNFNRPLRAAGNVDPVVCTSAHAQCGSIKNGIALMCDKRGPLVLDFDDLKALIVEIEAHRAADNDWKPTHMAIREAPAMCLSVMVRGDEARTRDGPWATLEAWISEGFLTFTPIESQP